MSELCAKPSDTSLTRRLRVAGMLGTVVLSLVLAVAPAQAAKQVSSQFGPSGAGDGQFGASSPRGVAVYEATLDIYAGDRGNNRVQQFDSGGLFLSQWGSFCNDTTVPCFGGRFDRPWGVAVDQSDGSIYVVDSRGRRVQKFDSSGAFLRAWGWDVVSGNAETAFEICTVASSCKKGTSGAGDGQFTNDFDGHPAVDPATGNVYVPDRVQNRVQKFDSSGNFLSKFGTAGAGDGQFSAPTHVAVDSTGAVYVADRGNGRVQKCLPDAGPPETFACTVFAAATLTGLTPHAIAVDPTDNHFYVATRAVAGGTGEVQIKELDPLGGLVDTHGVGDGICSACPTSAGTGAGAGAGGVAVSPSSGLLYVSAIDAAGNRMLILGGATVTIAPASDVTDVSATLNGTVDPNGSPTTWHFEYRKTGQLAWTSAPVPDADAGAGADPVSVSQPISGLEPGTQYDARLVADGAGPPGTSSQITFTTTSAPVIASSGATAGATTATLRGRINPKGFQTSYHFEYGTDTSYGSAVPVPDADIGSGSSFVAVSEQIAGLEPDTTYHFRLVATNTVGVTEGPDRTFTTGLALPEPPPGRAYEQVSPEDKNGNDAHGGVWASPSGDGVVWASAGSFSGQPSAPGFGWYLSLRQPPSWTTTGISSPDAPHPSTGGSFIDLLSDDLSKSVARTEALLAPGAAPDMHKLYLHDHATHSYRLITPAPPAGTDTDGVVAVDGTPDLRHVLFGIPAIETGAPDHRLYHWVDDGTEDGAMSVASVLPDGTPVDGTAGGWIADSNEPIHNSISDDGSVVWFTSPEVSGSSRVYRREGGATVLVHEEENPDPTVGSGFASFLAASTDGSKALIASRQRLVAADTNGNDASGGDLYLYTHSDDPATDDNLTLLSADHEPADGLGATLNDGDLSGGLVAASDDLSRVYFVASNQIVAGEDTTAERKLYVWVEGEGVSYLGGLLQTDERLWSSQAAINRGFKTASPDGRQLLVIAKSQLLPSVDNGGLQQAYLYDAAADEMVCVSCPAGQPPTAEAVQPFGDRLHNPRARRQLSADGSRAFFTTATALVSGDVNGDPDVYMWEDGAPHLMSSGKGDGGAVFIDASASGDDVFFSTPEPLVSWDTDSLADVYDARVGGGLPAPPSPRVPCEGDECQGEPASPPRFTDPGSSSLESAGNAAPGERPSFRLARVTKAQRARLARTGRLRLRARVNQAGRLSLIARAKMSKRSRIVDRSSRTARKAGTVGLNLRLSKAARRGLARGRTLRVVVSVRFAGVREPRTLTLRLRRAAVRSNGRAG